MMNMMYSTGFGTSISALWGVHILSVVLLFAGIILLVIWAAKALTKDQLKLWGITLVVIGAIACLLTIGARGAPWMMRYNIGDVGSTRILQWNADDDLPAGMMQNGMGMSMMLRGKTGDNFDKAFLTLMIPHHQDAINMANDALKNAKHAELRELAKSIISAQQSEIDMMNQWLKDWGYAE